MGPGKKSLFKLVILMFSKCCSEPWDCRGGNRPRKGKLAPDDTHDQAGSCGSPDLWYSSHLKHFSQSKEDETENTGERPARPTHRPGAREDAQCRGRSQPGCLARRWDGKAESCWAPATNLASALMKSCSSRAPLLLPQAVGSLCPPHTHPSLLRPSSPLLGMKPRPKRGAICIAVSDLGPRARAPALWLPVQQHPRE